MRYDSSSLNGRGEELKERMRSQKKKKKKLGNYVYMASQESNTYSQPQPSTYHSVDMNLIYNTTYNIFRFLLY